MFHNLGSYNSKDTMKKRFNSKRLSICPDIRPGMNICDMKDFTQLENDSSYIQIC